MKEETKVRGHTEKQQIAHAGRTRGEEKKYELKGQRLYVHSLGSGTD